MKWLKAMAVISAALIVAALGFACWGIWTADTRGMVCVPLILAGVIGVAACDLTKDSIEHKARMDEIDRRHSA